MATMPRVVGGRYGLSSKEFTPAMVKGVFDELAKDKPKNRFTVGIIDDVSHTSLDWDPSFKPDAGEGVTECVFYGLGSDGTVSANKNSIKIISEETPNFGQGYFEYDSKKAGAVTISHLRFGPKPINSTYLIGDDEASFVACHQPTFLTRYDMLAKAKPGGTFLLNSPTRRIGSGTTCRRACSSRSSTRAQVLHRRRLRHRREDRHGPAHQHHHADLLLRHLRHPAEGRGHRQIKEAVKKTYGKKGQTPARSQLRGHRRHARRPAPGAVPGRSPAASSARRGAGRCAGLRAERHRHADRQQAATACR
jgi:pyruvate-ferredoxin/flavodoxin oxidoreductase